VSKVSMWDWKEKWEVKFVSFREQVLFSKTPLE
jgi:hypothetical protein